MTANLAIPLPGSEPPQAERRIKWMMDDAEDWFRAIVLRIGRTEFVLCRLPDLEIAAQTAILSRKDKS